MVTLTIDDRTYAKLARRAKSDGMTVEEWLVEEADAQPTAESDSAPGHLRGRTREEWRRDFEAMLAEMKPRNSNVDDSRESIYPVRT